MIRKLLWTGLYAGLGAAATLGARAVASRVWRVATGEQPPVKKLTKGDALMERGAAKLAEPLAEDARSSGA